MLPWGQPVRAVPSAWMQRAAQRPVLEPPVHSDCLVSPPDVLQELPSKERVAPGLAQAQAPESARAPLSAVPPVRAGPLPQPQSRGQVRFAGPQSSASGSLTASLTLQSRTPKLPIESLESI